MADPLDTVTKLIALALNNPNEEEARSAALKAVKMIRENGFTLMRPATVAPPPLARAAYWQDLQDQMARAHAQRQAQRQAPMDWNLDQYTYYGYDGYDGYVRRSGAQSQPTPPPPPFKPEGSE